jgi:DNA-binding MarR family transcriptional regulator
MSPKQFPWDPISEARRQWAAHGWRDASRGMAVVTSVMRVRQILLTQAEHTLKPFGITFSRYEVLMLLYFSRSGQLPMKKIGQRLQVHPASITNAMEKLVRADLVRRESDPTDGRSALITLTADGRTLALEATKAINRDVFETLGLPSDRLSELFDILSELRAASDDF